jgi:hypothetical protein
VRLCENSVVILVDNRWLLTYPTNSLLAYDQLLMQIVTAIRKRAGIDNVVLVDPFLVVFMYVFLTRHLFHLRAWSNLSYEDSRVLLRGTSSASQTRAPLEHEYRFAERCNLNTCHKM